MSKIVTLYINSKNRISGTSSDFIFNILPYGLRNIRSYNIKNVSIPYSFYTTSYSNNSGTGAQYVKVIDQTGFIERTISLPFGNYAYSDITDILTSELNSSGLTGTYTVSFNTHNNKFTISNSSETFGINWATSQYPDQPDYKKLSYVMGFNNVNLDLASSYTSAFSSNLSGGMNCYIKSSCLSYMLTSYFENKGDTVICTIPINTNPGGVINYYDPLTLSQFNQTNFINVFDFQLVDEYNNIIDLNGLDWSFNIVFFCDPY